MRVAGALLPKQEYRTLVQAASSVGYRLYLMLDAENNKSYEKRAIMSLYDKMGRALDS